MMATVCLDYICTMKNEAKKKQTKIKKRKKKHVLCMIDCICTLR